MMNVWLDAIVVCGLGPLRLQNLNGSGRLFPLHPYNRHTALAAKLLAANGMVGTAILSGWDSNRGPTGRAATEAELREIRTTEAELLADVYQRVRGKGITAEGQARAEAAMCVDRQARTTGSNIIGALNILDGRREGYWQGSFGILSSEYHLPRIAELIRALGLENAIPLSAQAIIKHYGYRHDRLYPVGEFGYGMTYTALEDEMYKSELTGLRNLRANPEYLTFDLAKFTSDRRLHQVAASLRLYYGERGVGMPEVYKTIPLAYDPAFEYDRLRQACARIPPTKHPYLATQEDAEAHRKQAEALAIAHLPPR